MYRRANMSYLLDLFRSSTIVDAIVVLSNILYPFVSSIILKCMLQERESLHFFKAYHRTFASF